MKYVLVFFLALGVTKAKAQAVKQDPYADSMIQIQATQLFANYVGQYVRNTIKGDDIWRYASIRQVIAPYIGSGLPAREDSLFTVTIAVHYVKGALNKIISNTSLKAAKDLNKVVYDSPDIVGYTGLGAQLTSLAAGNGPYKGIAQNILAWWNDVEAKQKADRDADYISTVQWKNFEP